MALWLLSALFVVCFLLIALRGAPYVPTHRAWVRKAVALAPPSGTLVDLGSGDGIVLKTAAESGRKSLGIELNPLLVAVSLIRLRRFRHLSRVRLGDFWLQQLPADTSVVFVFLAGPFMAKLDKYLRAEATRLGRELTLISYGFELPGVAVQKRDGPLVVQKIQPLQPRV